MTMVASRPVRCSLCGHQDKQAVLLSTSTRGEPDLDSRPLWAADAASFVMRCGACGYAARDIETASEDTDSLRALVASPAYREVLARPDVHLDARPLLADALIQEHRGNGAAAAWATLWAAWVCDDRQDGHGAKTCRSLALDRFGKLRAKGLPLSERSDTLPLETPAGPYAPGAEDLLVIADVQRRLGRFPAALESCAAALALSPEGPLLAYLRAERWLCTREFAGRYNRRDALERRSPEAIRFAGQYMAIGCLLSSLCLVGGCTTMVHIDVAVGLTLLVVGVLAIVGLNRIQAWVDERLSRRMRSEVEAVPDLPPSEPRQR